MLLPSQLWSSVQLGGSICFPLEPLLRASHTSSQRSYGFTGRLAALPQYLIASIWCVWVTLRLFAQLLGNITLRHYMHNYVQLYETNLFYLMRIPQGSCIFSYRKFRTGWQMLQHSVCQLIRLSVMTRYMVQTISLYILVKCLGSRLKLKNNCVLFCVPCAYVLLCYDDMALGLWNK